jgi:glycosyltransferase 2 family protein
MNRPSRAFWRVARVLGGAAILAVVVWRLGTGPIVAGLESISVGPLVVAAALTAVTTVCAAWRWRLVAQGMGVALPLPVAISAYYRSQFLNTALPGGVLGDVHRGVIHGREAGDVARGLRAVAWERLAGQLVQLLLALVVLLVFPSPVRSVMLVAVAGAAVFFVALVLVLRVAPGRWAQTLVADVRQGLPAWPGITVASILIVVGHAATFLLAARVAGVHASVAVLLPLTLLVLLAMVVPVSVGGWGPREGAAAWLFGAAGLGADRGIATATVYGVMVLVSSLPGAVVLLARWHRRAPLPEPWPDDIGLSEPLLLLASGEGRARG